MKTMKFSRREFMSALTLGTGYMMFANPLTACSGPGLSTDPFQIVKLGNSGLKTTLLGMGTGTHGHNRSSSLSRQQKDESIAVLRHAYDVGIRMFDLADSYGTHPLMAEVLPSIPRDEVTLISKIWVREGGAILDKERPDADVVVERFLKELKTDYIDLVQLHCLLAKDWTDHFKWQMDILEDLKSKGVIRAHGVSVHTTEAMKAALASPWVDVIHARINPYGIAMDQPEPEEVVSLIHQLHDSGKGVIGMKLIGNGDLSQDPDKIDNTFRFVMGLGSVDMVIIGFDYIEQIDDYIPRMRKILTEMHNA